MRPIEIVELGGVVHHNPTVKVLVAYHKPAKLFSDDIFIPIHCGRQMAMAPSKDGHLSEEEYSWMMENMIGDDTGDHISHLNRHFCELTALYWAWKNYDILGTPDYIGLCHYRRVFERSVVEAVAAYDIAANLDPLPDRIEKQFTKNHHTNDLCALTESLLSERPEWAPAIRKYMTQKQGYFYNMFLMKKDVFFNYCEALFYFIFKMHSRIPYDEYSLYNQRMPGFLAERFTGIFIEHGLMSGKNVLTQCPIRQCDVGRLKTVAPAAGEKNIPVIFSSDDQYACYLGVAIASLLHHADKNYHYDICILDGGISSGHKHGIDRLKTENSTIRFIDVSPYLTDVSRETFAVHSHFTILSYFRFFIPEIFSEYGRVIYLDTDIVVLHDIRELFEENIEGHPLGAVGDVEVRRTISLENKFKSRDWFDYLKSTLGMKSPEKYFQSGVLILDVDQLKRKGFTQSCLNRLKQIGTPRYVDQDVLNSLYSEDVHFMDMVWNVEWQLPIYEKDLDHQMPAAIYSKYFESRKHPKLIHYCGGEKPWSSPEHELSGYWWHYARMTPFYEEIVFKNLHRRYSDEFMVARKLGYYGYKLLSKVTFGATRAKCRRKRNEFKMKLKRGVA